MSHTSTTFHPLFTARAVALALVVSALPLSLALAQSLPMLKVGGEETEVKANARGKGDVLMVASPGTTLEFIDTDGDRYAHRENNWYFVLLPRDPWGAQRAGWISARAVEMVPAPPRPAARAEASPVAVAVAPPPRTAATPVEAARAVEVRRPTPTPAAVVDPRPIPDVTVNFQFGRSELSAEAKAKLAEPASQLKATQGLAVAVEGHADWVGSAAFNEQLGLARAENVKRYLAEEYQIPTDKMSVVSYGEGQPAASNATKEGRAENRRVVVKVKP